ncbi:prepilin-type N-terminal cleavage/methylation domain-containing protein [Candidatus Saccharibacteria bacterium]|jgi:prepilin-type N-terminal cleavage/methylation domain-containing protein|nr:prepilin-type N-terminal cleavage/methylation domain-containing protein [Candidatus Saccharibacteria bacterium]
MSTKLNKKGFTIVELLIVIVVIGILAALVITTFTGIQQRARNTERETDIKAVHGLLEAYYAQKGAYPTLAQINDTAWRGENMKGMDPGAIQDPKGTSAALGSSAATSTSNNYGYVTTGTCAGTASPTTNVGDCSGYTLSWWPEGEATVKVKNALN